MIGYYYDLNKINDFERLFSGLYIYDNPTEKKNSYYILKFNFSGMDISENTTEKSIKESLMKEYMHHVEN